MAAYEVLLLNTAIPQIQAAQSGDTYVVPRDIAFSTVASFAAGAEATPSIVVTGDTNTGIWFPAADTVAISTGGISRLRLDASGNLGLGVTPSAWGGSYKGLQVNSTGALTSNGSNATGVGHNYFFDGTNNRYLTTGSANLYLMFNSEHRWYNAPSGTANTTTITNLVSYTIITSGNQTDFGAANNNVGTVFTANASGTLSSGTVSQNISFTQAMTLDASGNLSIGDTTTTGRFKAVVANSGTLQLAGTFTNNANADFNINIKTSETWIGPSTSTPLIFANSGNTERARITSGGYFKASNDGTYASSTGNFHELRTSTNDTQNTTFSHTAASPYGIVIRYTAASPNNTDNWFWYCDDGGATQRASLKSNGGLYNYQANDSNLSDRREKTNFAPAKSYLDTICAIPVQTFNYIDQSEDDPGLTLGVVAQDVQAVAPELVTESNWGTKDDPKMRLSIYQTDLQYALMKCIQELKSELDSVKAELAALKGA